MPSLWTEINQAILKVTSPGEIFTDNAIALFQFIIIQQLTRNNGRYVPFYGIWEVDEGIIKLAGNNHTIAAKTSQFLKLLIKV